MQFLQDLDRLWPVCTRRSTHVYLAILVNILFSLNLFYSTVISKKTDEQCHSSTVYIHRVPFMAPKLSK